MGRCGRCGGCAQPCEAHELTWGPVYGGAASVERVWSECGAQLFQLRTCSILKVSTHSVVTLAHLPLLVHVGHPLVAAADNSKAVVQLHHGSVPGGKVAVP
eukprot:361975-Chlamydomonas_euryale.AAC.9